MDVLSILGHGVLALTNVLMLLGPIVLLAALVKRTIRLNPGAGSRAPAVRFGWLLAFILVYGDPKSFHPIPTEAAFGSVNDPDRMRVAELFSSRFWSIGFIDFYTDRLNPLHYPVVKSIETILGVPRFNSGIVFSVLVALAARALLRDIQRAKTAENVGAPLLLSLLVGFYCLQLLDWLALSIATIVIFLVLIPFALAFGAGVGKGVGDFGKAVVLSELFKSEKK